MNRRETPISYTDFHLNRHIFLLSILVTENLLYGAVLPPSNTNFQVLTSQEAHIVSQLVTRLDEAEKYYRGPDVNELR